MKVYAIKNKSNNKKIEQELHDYLKCDVKMSVKSLKFTFQSENEKEQFINSILKKK